MTSRTRNGPLDARPLERRHMPVDHPVSLDAYFAGLPAGQRIPDELGPAQQLAGFEDTYRNVVDYIVRITHRIWEERDVEYIRACYSPDSVVFDDYGRQLGNAKIVADTHHATGTFSDMELVAEEVVWAGDDEVGFHTSHRVRIRGTHDGASRYGAATGRRVDFLCIANCVALDNDIFLEHVSYNTASLLGQLGHDPMAMAATLAADPPPGWPRGDDVWDALRGAARPPAPLSVAEPLDGFDPDAFARAAFDALWNGDARAALERHYRPDARVAGPTDRTFDSAAGYGRFVAALRGAFPTLALAVDEVYWMRSGEAYRVAVRWSAEGEHTGEGLYGAPSGAAVRLWGLSQLHVADGRIVREWMLFNELDVMMQIQRARGIGG